MGVHQLWSLIRTVLLGEFKAALARDQAEMELRPDRDEFRIKSETMMAAKKCMFGRPSYRRLTLHHVEGGDIERVPRAVYAALPTGAPANSTAVLDTTEASTPLVNKSPKTFLIVVDGNIILYKHLELLFVANNKIDEALRGSAENDVDDVDAVYRAFYGGGGGDGGSRKRRSPPDDDSPPPPQRMRLQEDESGEEDVSWMRVDEDEMFTWDENGTLISFGPIVRRRLEIAKKLFSCSFQRTAAAAADDGGGEAGPSTSGAQQQQQQQPRRCTTYDQFFKAVFYSILQQVKYITTSDVLGPREGEGGANVSVVVVLDGVPNVFKWRAQIKRRRNCIVKAMEAANNNNRPDEIPRMWEACKLTALGDCMLHFPSYVNEVLLHGESPLAGIMATMADSFTVVPPSFPGEGEVKMIDILEYARMAGGGGTDELEAEEPRVWDVAVMVTNDSDALLQAVARMHKLRPHIRDLYIYSQYQSDYNQGKSSASVVTRKDMDDKISFDLDLRTIMGPHSHNGLFHIMDDILARTFDLPSCGYVHPFQVVVPLLMFGGMEVLPYMVPVDRTRIAAMRKAIASCCEIEGAESWEPIVTNSRDIRAATAAADPSEEQLVQEREREARRQSQFRQCLAVTLEAFLPGEGRTISARTKKMERMGQQRAESIIEAYLRMYYWSTLYACGDKTIRWYADPSVSHALSESKELYHACPMPLNAVLNYLRRDMSNDPHGRQRNLCSDMCKVVTTRFDRNGSDVITCNKFLNAMYIYSTVSDNFDSQDLSNTRELRRMMERYDESCVCTVNSRYTHDPRDVMTLEHSGARRNFVVDARNMLQNLYDDCVLRLREMPYDVHSILETAALPAE